MAGREDCDNDNVDNDMMMMSLFESLLLAYLLFLLFC